MESSNSKIFTKDNIVKLIISIRKTKSVIDEIKLTKERILAKKDILLTTLEKTKKAVQNIEQEYSEYKEFISYVIDIDYYIKKYKYASQHIDKSEIHDLFNKFTNSKICIDTIKTHPNIKFNINIQKIKSYRDNLNYLINVNTTELKMYNNKSYKKTLENLHIQLSKINI